MFLLYCVSEKNLFYFIAFDFQGMYGKAKPPAKDLQESLAEQYH